VTRDLDVLTSWHADWSGLRVAVLGLGTSGFAVVDTLIELEAHTLAVAASVDDERRTILEVLGGELVLEPDASVVPQRLIDFDPELVVVSPGYRPDHALLVWAADRGIPVWGDIELAWRLRDKVGTPAEWILVTGTNGKTTTVQLTTHLLRAAGSRAEAVGNIGVPVLDAIRAPEGFDHLVVELSSFQLHQLPETGPGALLPLASVCLNLADDHLDWHGSREEYARVKGRVYANTRVACIYNLGDEATRHMVEEADVQEGCRAIGFGLGSPGPSDLGVVDGILVDRAFHADRHRSALEITTVQALSEAGLATPHMASNVLAATALARAADVPVRTVRDALGSFRLDHHRTESVAFAEEILWVDDSKATNPHAAAASLRSFDKVVWIVGGLLKGVDIAELVRAHTSRLRAAVVIGLERDEVLDAFRRHAPGVPVHEVIAADTGEVMTEAVRLSAEVATAGDVVLLAPAAASMDQFVDYGDRGRRFAAAVEQHVRKGSAGDARADEPADLD
jgi:UDP-N-acetylmuramoylalanine--D-glutamate ligase